MGEDEGRREGCDCVAGGGKWHRFSVDENNVGYVVGHLPAHVLMLIASLSSVEQDITIVCASKDDESTGQVNHDDGLS